jgi:hypothetical protein
MEVAIAATTPEIAVHVRYYGHRSSERSFGQWSTSQRIVVRDAKGKRFSHSYREGAGFGLAAATTVPLLFPMVMLPVTGNQAAR